MQIVHIIFFIFLGGMNLICVRGTWNMIDLDQDVSYPLGFWTHLKASEHFNRLLPTLTAAG